MRMNKSVTMTAILLALLTLAGCNKIASISGGPADGHDAQWYAEHHAEAKAETDYCKKKYEGPNATQADIAKIPNYCMMADNANQNYNNNLMQWAIDTASCKNETNAPMKKIYCNNAIKDQKTNGLNTNDKEAQDMLATRMKIRW